MATAQTYCTHRELKDVFPQIDSFDTKNQLFGFTEVDSGQTFDNDVDIYQCPNTGLITSLFKNSNDMSASKQTLSDTGTTLNGSTTSTATTILLHDASLLPSGVKCYIKIENEIMLCTAKNDTAETITVVRGRLNTTPEALSNSAKVYVFFNPENDGEWAHSSDEDFLVMAVTDGTNPNDNLIEAGEEFSTLISRVTADASRYLDSKLDPNLPREQLKDKEGNFDFIIRRSTALIAAVFLIRSQDPTSEIANAMMQEAQDNIDSLNQGKASLSWQTTGDSSKGIIREVGTISGGIRVVDTRGNWSGTYDVLKVKIIDSGTYGTGTFSAWAKGNDKLGANEGTQIIDSEKITGDYQLLTGGLQIRFGASAYNSTATSGDTWEIEVHGWQSEVDNSAINSVRMSRR